MVVQALVALHWTYILAFLPFSFVSPFLLFRGAQYSLLDKCNSTRREEIASETKVSPLLSDIAERKWNEYRTCFRSLIPCRRPASKQASNANLYIPIYTISKVQTKPVFSLCPSPKTPSREKDERILSLVVLSLFPRCGWTLKRQRRTDKKYGRKGTSVCFSVYGPQERNTRTENVTRQK